MAKRFTLTTLHDGKAMPIILQVKDDMGQDDVIHAIKQSCDEYYRSGKLGDISRHDKDVIDYQDFMEWVPNSICMKYGIEKEYPGGLIELDDWVQLGTNLIEGIVHMTANLHAEDIGSVLKGQMSLKDAVCKMHGMPETAEAHIMETLRQKCKGLPEDLALKDVIKPEYIRPDINTLRVCSGTDILLVDCTLDIEAFMKGYKAANPLQ